MFEIKPERLPIKDDLINWYYACLELAEIIDRRYPVKGTFIWLPYGFKIMKMLVEILNEIFEKNGIEEVYFPLFVPLDFARINEEWYEGFKNEAFYVENENAILRPTGEPAMYPIFKYWIKDGKLPIRIVQTVSSFRKEGKTTHSLIRDREITFWHEIHTVHKTREEALEEMEKHKEIYNFIWKEVLCIPPIIVEKPKYEIFPGAESAFEFYSILPNGKLLENGSINNLGQAYAKKFDLFFVNENGEKQYVWQVCTGNGARFLVAAFTLHGDERGLVLPPKISPYQVIIITIPTKENDFFDEAEKLSEEFNKENIRVFVDKSEKIPGEKFNIWDIKGVPIRIEIGEKEVKEKFYTLYRRDTKERIKVKVDEIVNKIKKILEIEMPKFLFEKVEKYYKNIIVSCNELSEVEKCIKEGKIAKANWCGDKECFEKISQIESSVEAIGFLEEREFGKCIICNKETDRLTLIGKVY